MNKISILFWEVLNNHKLVGSLTIGVVSVFFGGGYTRYFIKYKKTFIPGTLNGQEYAFKDSPLWAWINTITFGPVLLIFGVLCLSFFLSQFVNLI